MDGTSPAKLQFDALSAVILDHAENRKPVARPRKMRKALEALHDPAWDTEHQEMLILPNCMGRMVPARTYGKLTILGAALTERGDVERLDRLRTLIANYLAPDSLTPHGYNVPFAELDAEEIFSAMGATLSPLADIGMPFFLYAGALLGHVRHGGLIEHDDDIDIAIMLGDCAPDEVGPRWREVKVQLDKRGLLTEDSRITNRPVYKFKSELGIDIDLFPSWTHEGKFSVYPYVLDAMPEHEILPLTSFGQDPLMYPANAEAFLEACYGPGWRVPDPLFHINWKQRKKMFAKLMAADYALPPREG